MAEPRTVTLAADNMLYGVVLWAPKRKPLAHFRRTRLYCRYNSVVWPSRSEVAMFQRNRKTEAFVDFINLALGGFLILSPWLLGFKSQLGWHTSWMAGAAIGVVAIFSIADLFDTVSIPAFFESEEWINLTIGSWLAICPWVLNFNDDTMMGQMQQMMESCNQMMKASNERHDKQNAPKQKDRHG